MGLLCYVCAAAPVSAVGPADPPYACRSCRDVDVAASSITGARILTHDLFVDGDSLDLVDDEEFGIEETGVGLDPSTLIEFRDLQVNTIAMKARLHLRPDVAFIDWQATANAGPERSAWAYCQLLSIDMPEVLDFFPQFNDTLWLALQVNSPT